MLLTEAITEIHTFETVIVSTPKLPYIRTLQYMRFRPLNCLIYMSQLLLFQPLFVGTFVQDDDQHQPSSSILVVGVMFISAPDVLVSLAVQNVNNGSNVTFDGRGVRILEFS
jgi:hypothetical protein